VEWRERRYGEPADPVLADSDLTNADAIKGNVAIVRRGVVKFSDKAERCVAAGAVAVIIVNTEDTAFAPSGDFDEFSVPVVGVASSTADLLLECVPVQVVARDKATYGPDFSTFMEERIRNVIRSITPLVCLDIFTRSDEEYEEHIASLKDLLLQPSYSKCLSSEEFFLRYGGSIVHSYLELNLSFESDREAAVCSVACAIHNDKYGQHCAPHDILERAWQGLCRLDSSMCKQPNNGVLACFRRVQVGAPPPSPASAFDFGSKSTMPPTPPILLPDGSEASAGIDDGGGEAGGSRGSFKGLLGCGTALAGTRIMHNSMYMDSDEVMVDLLDNAQNPRINLSIGQLMGNLTMLVGQYAGNSLYEVCSDDKEEFGADSHLKLYICAAPTHIQAIITEAYDGPVGWTNTAMVFVLVGSVTGKIRGVLNWIQCHSTSQVPPPPCASHHF